MERTIEATTLDEAMEEAKSIPEGHKVIATEVVSNGEEVRLEGVGATVEDAFKRLEERAKAINCKNVLNREVVEEPSEWSDRVAGLRDWELSSAYGARLGQGERIRGVKEVQAPKKGFLGIGARPRICEIVVDTPARVTMTIETIAQVIVKTAPKEAVDFVEECDLDGLKAFCESNEVSKFDDALVAAATEDKRELLDYLVEHAPESEHDALFAHALKQGLWPLARRLVSPRLALTLRDHLIQHLEEIQTDSLQADIAAIGGPILKPFFETIRDAGVEFDTRRFFMEVIEQVTDAAAVEALEEAVSTRADGARNAAIALGRIANPAAVGTLVQVLEDDDACPALGAAAAVALGQIGDKRAVQPLLVAANEKTYNGLTKDRKTTALIALCRIADPGSRSQVLKQLIGSISMHNRDCSDEYPWTAHLEELSCLFGGYAPIIADLTGYSLSGSAEYERAWEEHERLLDRLNPDQHDLVAAPQYNARCDISRNLWALGRLSKLKGKVADNMLHELTRLPDLELDQEAEAAFTHLKKLAEAELKRRKSPDYDAAAYESGDCDTPDRPSRIKDPEEHLSTISSVIPDNCKEMIEYGTDPMATELFLWRWYADRPWSPETYVYDLLKDYWQWRTSAWPLDQEEADRVLGNSQLPDWLLGKLTAKMPKKAMTVDLAWDNLQRICAREHGGDSFRSMVKRLRNQGLLTKVEMEDQKCVRCDGTGVVGANYDAALERDCNPGYPCDECDGTGGVITLIFSMQDAGRVDERTLLLDARGSYEIQACVKELG